MKKLFSIVLCSLLFFCLVGCSYKNDFDIGEISDIEILNRDVELVIKEGSLSNTGAVLILKNNSDTSITYGTPYEIEINKDGKWYKINVELYFTMPAFELKPGEEKEIELDWEYGYGKLAKGEYRIIKDYTENVESDEYKKLYVACEFVIE